MSTYTIKQLCDDGPQFAMAMLIECIKNGEPFVTYGAIARELEYQLEIHKIFVVKIGSVAGTLMNRILEIDPEAPLINALITSSNGIPGSGVGGYFADRYNNDDFRSWGDIPKDEKRIIVQKEREKIFKYKKWKYLNKKLFGKRVTLNKKTKVHTDSEFSNHGRGGGESEEHENLKKWVSNNPRKIGINKLFKTSEVESRLLSGDVIDVLFSSGISFKTVEVKSYRSNDNDLKRGLYQCVKYRAVKKAEHLPFKINVEAILVTERELPSELKERAKLLKVRLRVVKVNILP